MPSNPLPRLRGLQALPAESRLPALGDRYGSVVAPTPLPEPRLAAFSPDAAALIDLDPDAAATAEFLQIMAGNRPFPGGCTLATVYAGHQFGVLVPQLGDGRAILIAELRNARGEPWELQLKGAGRTPYSRFGDGRAVLRSTIREFLCSEAMAGLGIPSTRALCIVSSPEPVRRETVETAAVLCRMAPSHIRFGHFEYFYYRRDFDALKPLADHVMATHFPSIAPSDYSGWLAEVVERTARLAAQWQAVGFCHGVLNSDNMSILGLTLDYGPYGFLDAFDVEHVCNHSDENGRYAYHQQPAVAHWNCSRLLQATLPLLHEQPGQAVEIAQAVLARFESVFVDANLAQWRSKLGLREAHEVDSEMINSWLQILHRSRADFSTSFRNLARVPAAAGAPAALRDDFLEVEAFDAWLQHYRARLAQEPSDDAARAARMDRVNPQYVLRNHLAQRAIEKAQTGDFSEIETLRGLLARPYDTQPGMDAYAQPPPPGLSSPEVSCSS